MVDISFIIPYPFVYCAKKQLQKFDQVPISLCLISPPQNFNFVYAW